MLTTWVSVAVAEDPPQTARPWMGVALEPDRPEALITKVYPGYPAYRAGLRAGDVLLAIDGSPIVGMEGCRAAIGAKHDGDRITLRVRRGVEEEDVRLKLEVMPPQDRLDQLDLVEAPAPSYEVETWVGPDSLSSLKDHVVVLEFFATWCKPCTRYTAPRLAAWQAKYAARGLKILALSEERWDAAVLPYLAAHPLPYTVGSDRDRAVSIRFHQRYFPTLVVIDAGGVVRAIETSRGLDEVEAVFVPLLRPRRPREAASCGRAFRQQFAGSCREDLDDPDHQTTDEPRFPRRPSA